MRKNNLGRSGIEVSELSFGTVSLGIPYGIGIRDRKDMLSEPEAIALLASALDKGINFFDTARGYGNSETILGKAFKGRRNEAVICTKPDHLYNVHKGRSLPPDAEIKKILSGSFEKCLTELQTDYVDVLMSHDGTEEVIENNTVIDFYQGLKKSGIIRATGVSVYTPEQSIRAVKSGVWDVIQLAFNLMDQRQLPAIEFAGKQGVGIVVRSALFKGILTDRGTHLHSELRNVEQYREKYVSLLNDHISRLSDLATKFVLSCTGVSSVLVGIDKPGYLNQALAVMDGIYLDEKTLQKAKALAYPDPEFLDLVKWNQMGWL